MKIKSFIIFNLNTRYLPLKLLWQQCKLRVQTIWLLGSNQTILEPIMERVPDMQYLYLQVCAVCPHLPVSSAALVGEQTCWL